ncbi:phosphatase PAP2 family protein [Candidatus Poribacteria bacterium]|nr:phosphatase PAP2 family protein [Candidatus Poribacteria bacterium]
MTLNRISFVPCAIGLVFILLINNTSSSNPFGDADRYLFKSISNDMQNDFLDDIVPSVQRMGEPQFYMGVCTLLCAFGDEKMYETGKLAMATFIEAGFVGYIMKHIVRSPRPGEENHWDKTSFPSGHAVVAFSLATIVGHQYPKLRIPVYLAALATGLCRIYLGRHYPSDILGGAAIGVLGGIHVIKCQKTVLSLSF